MLINDILKKVSLETYLKKNYLKICNELGIDKVDAKRLKKEEGQYLFSFININNENDFRTDILRFYSSMLLKDLGLIYSGKNYFFKSYSTTNNLAIWNLKKLLSDRHFAYNGFLFENLLCLKYSLTKPITQLNNINNLDMSYIEKYKEKNCLELEIYKVFDSFFEVIDNMMKEYVSDIYSKDAQIVNSEALDDLKKYSMLLTEMKSDMKKNTGIF